MDGTDASEEDIIQMKGMCIYLTCSLVDCERTISANTRLCT